MSMNNLVRVQEEFLGKTHCQGHHDLSLGTAQRMSVKMVPIYVVSEYTRVAGREAGRPFAWRAAREARLPGSDLRRARCRGLPRTAPRRWGH